MAKTKDQIFQEEIAKRIAANDEDDLLNGRAVYYSADSDTDDAELEALLAGDDDGDIDPELDLDFDF